MGSKSKSFLRPQNMLTHGDVDFELQFLHDGQMNISIEIKMSMSTSQRIWTDHLVQDLDVVGGVAVVGGAVAVAVPGLWYTVVYMGVFRGKSN